MHATSPGGYADLSRSRLVCMLYWWYVAGSRLVASTAPDTPRWHKFDTAVTLGFPGSKTISCCRPRGAGGPDLQRLFGTVSWTF